MSDLDRFNNFIFKGNFDDNAILEIEEKLSINNKQLIRKCFKSLNYSIGVLKNEEFHINRLEKLTQIICILCDSEDFTEEEAINYRIKIKKIRESVLAYSNKFKNDRLLECANRLDEVILDKNIKVDELIELIKALIDKKEDINIIKKFLNTNKGALIIENNKLFDYSFNYALDSLILNDNSIYYYIALLKIFYSSKIDKDKYIKKLNDISDDKNEFANEIYNIIHGVKRSLTPEEILDKYGIVKNPQEFKINIPKDILSNDRILTIDSESTRVRDDAISIKKDGNNTIIGIYIADPGKYIKQDSIVDINARNNFKNFNTVSRILPYDTENLFSLNKNKVRPVLSLYVVFDESYQIKDYKIIENYIIVKDNISFSKSDLIVENKLNYEYQSDLCNLYNLADILELQNHKKVDYWKKKDNGSLEKDYTDHKSDIIIRELMVLYNNLIATIACNNSIPYVYRTQHKSYLDSLIKKMDIEIDESMEKVLKSIYLTSKYSHIPLYHNGLNIKIYSHSTDPLRRYPDLYNQLLLHSFYFNDIDFNFNYEEYVNLINYFNERSTEIALMKSEYNRAMKLLKKS